LTLVIDSDMSFRAFQREDFRRRIKKERVIPSRWEETVMRESMLTLVVDEEDDGSDSERGIVFSSTATNQTSKQS
jgi:hypothetical protein